MNDTRERLRITYDLQDGPVSRTVELPLVIGVIADLSGAPKVTNLGDRGREFVRIDLAVAEGLLAATPDRDDVRASARGLVHLARQASGCAGVQIWALDASKTELAKNLRKFGGTVWDQSPLFKKMYDDRFACHGGEPFGCLVVDYEFDQTVADVATLDSLATIAEIVHCPLICGISPRFVHLKSWAHLLPGADPARLHQLPEYQAWRTWKSRSASAYVAMIAQPASASSAASPTSVSAVYAVAAAIAECFDAEGSWRSLQAKLAEPDATTTAFADLESLAGLLLTSRFRHYVRRLVRDLGGQSADPAALAPRLSNFLRQFVDGSPEQSSESTKLMHPLAGSEVTVARVEGFGIYPKAEFWLRPRTEHPATARDVRTEISYSVEMYGAERSIELPFVIGVLAGFSGRPASDLPPLDERRFLTEWGDSDVNGLIARVSPQLRLNLVAPDGEWAPIQGDLVFASLRDFSPAGVAENVPEARDLLDSRKELAVLLDYCTWLGNAETLLQRYIAGPTEPAASGERESADRAVAAASDFGVLTDEAREAIVSGLRRLTQLQESGEVRSEARPLVAIAQAIARHDERISRIVNAVIHHPDFQRLESAWIGLQRLLDQLDGDQIKVRILDVGEEEFRSTFADPDPADHWLSRRLLAEGRQQGGEPFGCLVADYSFDYNDASLLARIGTVSEKAFCPFIASASPSLFLMKSWQEVGDIRVLHKMTTIPDFESWRQLRLESCARFLVLAMPRFAGRRWYDESDRSHGFGFVEDDTTPENLTHVSAAFAVGQVVARSCARFGWPGQIAGVETGGTLVDLVPGLRPSDINRSSVPVPVEVHISDRRLAELVLEGLSPLVGRRGENRATLFQVPTLHAFPPSLAGSLRDELSRGDRLQYVLAESRFAHYVWRILQDKQGSFQTADDACRWLTDWIHQYVDGDPEASSSYDQSLRPLCGAELTVVPPETAGTSPLLDLRVRPHRHMERLSVSSAMRIELAPYGLVVVTPELAPTGDGEISRS